MKISEFKQYIRETIVGVLSEEEGTVTTKDPKQAKELADQGTDVNLVDKITENEDAEPSKAELQKTKSLAKAKEELAQLTKKMKAKAKDYKSAEGKEKDKIKDELKKMTAEKKKLEKSIQ